MSDVFAFLSTHAIPYERYDHEAVFTCEQAEKAVPPIAAAHTKNLFLRDKKGQRHWLLVTLCSKAVDLKQVAGEIGADKLSLGSPERLAKHLGVTPGAVTILALINDPDHAVELVVNDDVECGVHPRTPLGQHRDTCAVTIGCAAVHRLQWA